MKSVSAISKLALAVMIALPGVLPAYSVSAEEAVAKQVEMLGVSGAELTEGQASAAQLAEPNPLLFEDDFQDGDLTGWTLNNSALIKVINDPANANNKIIGTTNGDEAIGSIDSVTVNDYVYEAKVQKLTSGAFSGILVRYTDAKNYYMLQLGDGRFALSKMVGGTGTTLGNYTFPVADKQWYTLRLVVEGSSIKGYADDKLVFDVTDSSLATGKPGFRSRWNPTGYDDVKVYSIPNPKPTAPSNVQATDVTSSSATIEWSSDLENATYHVSRSTNATSGFTQIYSGAAKSFQDKGLSSGVTYYYQISAEINKYEIVSNTLKVTTVLVLPEKPELLPGIVAAYPFNETSGTQASPLEASSNQTKATLVGGAAWSAEGRSGGALDLNGSTGYVNLPQGVLNNLNELSIAFWAKQDTLKKWARVFDIGLGTNNYIFFTPSTDGDASRFVLKNGGSEQITGVSPAQQTTSRWMHYAMTLSGTTAILYVDGVEVARNENVTIKPKDLGNTTLNYIGRSVFSADPYYDGKLDDFYIFNRALGPAEVALFTYPEDQERAAADKQQLTLSGNLMQVMSDLQLPSKGTNGSAITWSSDKADIVAASGKVTRPAFGEQDADVILTATIKRGNAIETKAISLKVLAELSDAAAVESDKEALQVTQLDGVTAKLNLAKAGVNRTEITWSSDHPVHLRPDGMISRPAIGKGDLNVKLTATIKRGTASTTRVFDVKILEQDTFSAYLFAYNKLVNGNATLHYAVSRNGRNWTELGTNPSYVEPISGSDSFKLNSEDKWLKYTYANNAWTLASAGAPAGTWTQEASTSFGLPSGALDGSFKRIDDAQWNRLVNGLSTPRTLDPVQTIYTAVGQAPRLPDLIKIDYTNNLYVTVPVVWDTPAATLYDKAGTFKAEGIVKGTLTAVKVSVNVQDNTGKSDMIRNGEYWFDDEGGMIQAHGGYIVKEGDTYFWFGEDKGHNSAVLKGVSIYASKDLKNWEFRNTVLTPATHPELASAKIERPKVVYNEKTGKYVLWGHWEEAGNYNQANVIVAVADTIDGEYTYVNRFQPGGMQSRDFTVFKDTDGSAYLFSSSNNNADMNVFKLTDDYLYTEQFLYTLFPGGKRESPAIVKKDGIYYMFTSGLSGWYPNQGYYATTTSLTDKNAWSSLKMFGDPATYYTQSAFILTISGSESNSHVYVGDRWNPTALMNSQYIWLPLELNGGTANISYSGEWDLNAATGLFETPKDLLVSQGKPVTASLGTNPGAANDGNYTNYYEFGGAFPVTWSVDLGREYDLSRIDLSWREWNGSEVYVTYKIEGSNDGTNYKLLIDQTANRTTSFNSHKLKDKYRYVRVTITGQYGHTNNADRLVTWYTGLHEVKIFSSNLELDAPIGLSGTAVNTATGKSGINVSWQKSGNADFYELYRSDTKDGTYELKYKGFAAAYEDRDTQAGQTYYYKVKAGHAGGSSPLSEAIGIKAEVTVVGALTFDNRNNLWYDTEGNIMPIGSYLKAGDVWYYYTTTLADGHRFSKMIVYTSTDFKNWKLKSEPLLTDESHTELNKSKLEALSVIYNEKTQKYVAWFHYENDADYTLARVAPAVADSPDGPFTFQGSFRPLNNDSRDLTTFVDTDGSAYLISSTNTNADMKLYKLTDDYLKVDQTVPATTIYAGKHREAPSMVKKDGVYYLFTSGAAGWYPTQGTYSTATEITGPWSEPKKIGNASTFGGQSGNVLTLRGTDTTSYIMMANQWKPSDLKSSKRIWLPLTLSGGTATYDYADHISVNPASGVVANVTEGTLLSQGKPATATDGSGIYRAENANDGDYTSSWVGENNTWPKWWQVDLGDVYSLDSIQMSWYLHNGSEAYHQYTVEASTDGINYVKVLDKMDNTRYGFTSDQLEGYGRYVRVNLVNAVLHNNPSNWYTPQLYEVKVYGKTIKESLAVPAGLEASETLHDAIALTWTAVDGADGYNVYRSDALDGIYQQVNQSALTDAGYADSDLTAETTYYYKVTALFGSNESEQSSALTVKTQLAPTPTPTTSPEPTPTTPTEPTPTTPTEPTPTTPTEPTPTTPTEPTPTTPTEPTPTTPTEPTPTTPTEPTPTTPTEPTPTTPTEPTPTTPTEPTPTTPTEPTPTTPTEPTPTTPTEPTPTTPPTTTTPPTSAPTSTPSPTATPQPSAGISVKAPVDSTGTLQAELSAGDVSKAIEAAKDGKVSIQVEAAGSGTATGAKVTIPVQSLTAAEQGVKQIAVQSGQVTVTIRTAPEAGILASDSKQLALEVKEIKASELPESVQAQLGDHPVYDFKLSVDGEAVSAFNASNPITVEMKYTLKDGEKAHQMVIYYIGEDGKLEVVRNVKYDAATGTISFKPAHFSLYAASYRNITFADLNKAAWAQVKIEALAAREIINGIGEGEFAPNREITRAEFVQLLLGGLGLIDDAVTSALNDVQTDAWYYAAVASAEKLGIVKGRTNGSFGVHDTITREEMAVMLARAVALTGLSAEAGSNGNQAAFADQETVAAYAREAVIEMQKAGLINGFTDGSYKPKAQATRAQAAAVIYKLLEI